jgi:hypothetical protein
MLRRLVHPPEDDIETYDMDICHETRCFTFECIIKGEVYILTIGYNTLAELVTAALDQ